jgi:dolichol-phosphate mannosyltransferase
MPTKPGQDDRRHTVSVIVPMCNEEDSIALLAEKLRLLQDRLASRFTVEYCLVDDGSTDRTCELMSSAVPEGAIFVWRRHSSNRGLGAAIRTGMQAANGSIVCTIDADCSYPPEDLSALIDVVDSGAADVAVASPYHPKGGVIGVKPWRILLSRQCSRLYRCSSSLKLHTYTSIFRAYRGTVARQIEFRNDGFVSAVEMLFSADRLGYRVAEVPLVLRARERGYSKIRIAQTICSHISMMLSLLRMRMGDRSRSYSLLDNTRRGDASQAAPLSIAARLSEEDRPIG